LNGYDVQASNPIERQIILVGEDGKLLFQSARCQISIVDAETFTITDITRPESKGLNYD
jgi:hypothetical protein